MPRIVINPLILLSILRFQFSAVRSPAAVNTIPDIFVKIPRHAAKSGTENVAILWSGYCFEEAAK